VNGSQSKFLEETWPISQNRPDAPLFWHGQDHIAIEKLSALGNVLEIRITMEAQLGASKTRARPLFTKIRQPTPTHIFHQTSCGRVRETNMKMPRETGKARAFDPVAQVQYRDIDRSIKPQVEHSISCTQRNQET
jgi:hypothetical protein